MKLFSWIFILLLALTFSCSDKEKRIRKKDIIPKEDLIIILADIHIADGIMNMPKYLNKYPGKDTLSNYNDIFANHGYSREIFDKTLKYYSNHPDDFELLYENVLDNLSRFESEINSQRYVVEDNENSSNLWKDAKEWKLPQNGKRNKIAFSIPIDKQGFYIIRIRIKMQIDDGSINPRLSAYFWYDNGTGNGKRYHFPETKIKKDDTWRYYTISLKTTDPKITHLKGFILNDDNTGTDWGKKAEVENISIQRQILNKK